MRKPKRLKYSRNGVKLGWRGSTAVADYRDASGKRRRMTGWMAARTKSGWATYASELEAEIERLRAALEEVLEDYETYEFWTDDNGGYSKPTHDPEILRRARRALEGKQEPIA